MAAKGQTGKTGFARMDPEKRKELARRGGQTAQRLGKAHKFTREELSKGGKKGGQTVSHDRAHMAELGRKGLEARRRRAEAKGQRGKEQ